MLRAVHRRYHFSTLPYTIPLPVHSFKRADMQPMIPGEITDITFALLPISVLIPQGHHIRVAIAGADQDLFPRIPEQSTPTWQIYRSAEYTSYIDLPIIAR